MSELKGFCEAARQRVHDADAVARGGLKTPADIATFGRLMFEAGFAEATDTAKQTIAAWNLRSEPAGKETK